MLDGPAASQRGALTINAMLYYSLMTFAIIQHAFIPNSENGYSPFHWHTSQNGLEVDKLFNLD